MPRPYYEPEYRRRIREKAEKNNNDSNNERDRATKSTDIHKIVLAIKAIDEKYDRERHKDRTRKKWDRFWEVMGVAGLWLAAAVGIIAIWYGTRDASGQRAIMRGQLDYSAGTTVVNPGHLPIPQDQLRLQLIGSYAD